MSRREQAAVDCGKVARETRGAQKREGKELSHDARWCAPGARGSRQRVVVAEASDDDVIRWDCGGERVRGRAYTSGAGTAGLTPAR